MKTQSRLDLFLQKKGNHKNPDESTREKKVEYLINLDSSLSYVIRQWLDKMEAKKLFCDLSNNLSWRQEAVVINNKSVNQPRLVYACGDPGLVHSYSGLRLAVEPWHPQVKLLRDRIVTELLQKDKISYNLNAALLNRYKDGSQYIGWHSDKESLGFNNIVVTVSLGASRDFYFKHKITKAQVKTTLHSGDLVVMSGTCQDLWQHCIPKRAHAHERISITYRDIQGKTGQSIK